MEKIRELGGVFYSPDILPDLYEARDNTDITGYFQSMGSIFNSKFDRNINNYNPVLYSAYCDDNDNSATGTKNLSLRGAGNIILRGRTLDIKINRKIQHWQNWREIKAKQDRINNLPTDKEKIIAYNRDIAHIKDNYIIVDKKNFTATVYSPDGRVIKEYEIGVASEKGDRLLKRSYTSKEGQIKATSAGIYTANYRASGKDKYASTYNDRVLTLSNDGLKAKKVGDGSGETGVALHQVPNGPGGERRAEMIRRPGACEENNRFSAGCVNFIPEDFDDCMKHIKGLGTKVYILPEDPNNYFCVKNGQLHFAQKKYTGDVATTSTKNDPIKKISIESLKIDMRDEGRQMAATLSNMKEELSKELGLDNDTYNELALCTLGIAGQETKYGSPTAGMSDGKPYWVKEKYPGLVDKVKKWKGKKSTNSRGITQLKIGSYTDPEVKRLLNKYRINEDNLKNPRNAAIATMIVLACIYKNELPALKSKMEELGMSKEEAVLYCFNGRKSEITKGTATPSENIYVKNVRKFMKDFELTQSEC